ncbi:hypothetical protein K1T71_000950 [Dendrolimus kikuchii]|uniref:Uncharacterized protein n=1 Tax=Dendrolimus kikuchii TaxID=765133 RepID=A0ACC1DG67_9NEOP|nr:hypothetical protein K1T71_000950 [Dendrolimus kikuchii]
MIKVSIVLFLVFFNIINANQLKLKKVLALSRHNVRTPLTENLERVTPYEWNIWDDKAGCLTKKGALLESYIAEYFSMWLKDEELLPKKCPEVNSVYIYSNTKQRTKLSAIEFAKAAFKDCKVPVHFKNITTMDPTFNPIIHNATDAFKSIIREEMQKRIDATDLKDAYLELNKILNFENSKMCKEDGACDLATDKTKIVSEVGYEPNVDGPLFIGNAVVDAFIMSFFEGKPLKDVAWGKIIDEEQWKLLSKITKANQDVRFNLTNGYNDFAGPLLKLISEYLLNDVHYKLIYLVGHDSNLNPVMNALGIKPFVLPNQFEPYPIGGKIVFQKWSDGKDYLKLEYIYQSWLQLREGTVLNFNNPPEKVVLELKGCPIDEKGLCPWDDFVTILKQFE